MIYKEVFGQGNTLVMLHGWGMHSGLWREFSQQLAVNYQVQCLDLCGHGRSESIEPYTLDALVDVLIVEFPDEPCVLMGWSLGGNIALRLVEKYPERVCGLILLACNPHFLCLEDWPGISVHALEQFSIGLSVNASATLWRFMSLQIQGIANVKLSLKKLRALMSECPIPTTKVLESGLAILRTHDGRASLSALKIPVQYILGEQDTLVPVEVGGCCLAIQPKLGIHIIKGAGHTPFITHDIRVLAIVNAFVTQRYV